jgi:hypothetical protein
MSFLTVNGYAVSAAVDSVSIDYEELGGESRAEDGSLRYSRLVEMLIIEAQSVALKRAEWTALRGLIRGRGHRFAFDLDAAYAGTNPTAAADYYSANGLAPYLLSAITSRGVEPVYRPAGLRTGTKFGTGCIEVASARTNLLSSNVATGTDTSSNTTGFTGIATGTPTSSTEQAWQATRALKLAMTSANDGVLTDAVAAAASTWYAGSCYVRAASGTPQVQVRLRDSTGAEGNAVTATLSSSQWTRVECAMQTAGGATTISLRIIGLTSAFDFYVDGLQIEASANGANSEATSVATSWVNGSRGARSFAYQLGFLHPEDELTVMFWTAGPAVAAAAQRLFAITSDGGNEGLALSIASGGGLSCTTAVGGASTSTTVGTFGTSQDWKHVTLVMRRVVETGELAIECYVDGVAQSGGSPTLPSFSATPLFDEFIVLPYAVTAGMVTAFYNRAFSNLPELEVAGDLVGDTIYCRGSTGALAPVEAAIDSTMRRTAGALPYTLRQSRVA